MTKLWLFPVLRWSLASTSGTRSGFRKWWVEGETTHCRLSAHTCTCTPCCWSHSLTVVAMAVLTQWYYCDLHTCTCTVGSLILLIFPSLPPSPSTLHPSLPPSLSPPDPSLLPPSSLPFSLRLSLPSLLLIRAVPLLSWEPPPDSRVDPVHLLRHSPVQRTPPSLPPYRSISWSLSMLCVSTCVWRAWMPRQAGEEVHLLVMGTQTNSSENTDSLSQT